MKQLKNMSKIRAKQSQNVLRTIKSFLSPKIIKSLKEKRYYNLAYKVIATYSLNFLPKVAIIKKKGTNKEAEAMYNKIYVYEKFAKLRKPMQRHVLAHELGHVFQDLNDISTLELQDKNFAIFEYELFNNPMEGFAEGFAVYVMKPSELKKRYPEQYKIMKNWVGNTSKVKDWIKIVVKNFKKMYKDQVYKLDDFENMVE